MKFIDDFLNGITMYRLLLYFLLFLLVVAEALAFLGLLSFSPLDLFAVTAFLLSVCWMTNTIFSKVFKVPTNLESVYITALILALIIPPTALSFSDAIALAWVAILSEACKYIFAVNKKHIFNPAALAVFITAVTLNYSASWWVGNAWMVPFVLIGGLLIVRKIRRFSMIFSFLITAIVVILGLGFLNGNNIFSFIERTALGTPVLFFAFVMLTEPLTTPPTKKLQMIYGGLVGLLFAPQIHLGSFYTTPEIALLIGNIFSYLVSPKEKLVLKLKEKVELTPDTYDFVFDSDQHLNFLSGQYLEWTLSHPNTDSRGSRRYFTIASSPTEGNLRFGVKFYSPSSSLKKALVGLKIGDEMIASQLAGEFTLPKDPNKKLVFIAGGIGVTPFRSMIKDLFDINQRRDIVILYSSNLVRNFVYKDIFDAAFQKLGIRTVYTLTEPAQVPPGWPGRVGFIDSAFIAREVPDYRERIFYISGPHSMVDSFTKILKGLGLPGNQIKTDFFPGYA